VITNDTLQVAHSLLAQVWSGPEAGKQKMSSRKACKFDQPTVGDVLEPAQIRAFRLDAKRFGWVFTIALLVPGPVVAQSAEEFYRGKTINFVIGYPTGGAPDIYARLVARHMAKHIAGKPNMVARNMPGAGSLTAANHMFNTAPKDGTSVALTSPTMPLEEMLGVSQVKFRASQFNWLGRLATNPNITFIANTSPVKTIKDAFDKVAILGATARSSTNAIYPFVLNNVLGTKFRIVTGYEGTAAVILAMERGEVEGLSSTYDGLKAQREDWLKTKKVNIVVQYLLRRHPELPDVPTSLEVASTPEQVMILRTVSSASEIGKFVFTTPEVPADRVVALRKAFDAMVKDPDFLAEATRLRIEIDPLSGADLQKIVRETQSIPADLIERVKAIYPLN
jgi:tripartite-type tricarboxylate transporter receptor subunit TctC